MKSHFARQNLQFHQQMLKQLETLDSLACSTNQNRSLCGSPSLKYRHKATDQPTTVDEGGDRRMMRRKLELRETQGSSSTNPSPSRCGWAAPVERGRGRQRRRRRVVVVTQGSLGSSSRSPSLVRKGRTVGAVATAAAPHIIKAAAPPTTPAAAAAARCRATATPPAMEAVAASVATTT